MLSPPAAGASNSTPGPSTTAATREPRRAWSGGLLLIFIAIGLLSFNTIRIADFPISDLFFVAATGTVWLYFLTGRTRSLSPLQMRRTPPLIFAGVLLLLFGGVVSSLWALDPIGSMMRVARLAWITILWFWLMRTVISGYLLLQTSIKIFKGTMYVAAAIAITNYLGLTNLVGDQTWTHAHHNREVAYFTHPNTLGGALAVALPLVIVEFLRLRVQVNVSSKQRILLFAQITLVIVGISSTGSMTAMGAAVTGTATLGLLHFRSRHQGQHRPASPLVPMALAVLLGALVLVVNSTGLPIVERFTELMSGESSGIQRSAESRPEQNLYVVNQIDQFLIIGVGHDLESREESWDPEEYILGRGVHNMVLKLLWEAGLIAVIGYGIILITTVRQAWTMIHVSRESNFQLTVIALLSALVAANTSALMNPIITERWYWLPTAFIGIAWALRYRQIDANAVVQATDDDRAGR